MSDTIPTGAHIGRVSHTTTTVVRYHATVKIEFPVGDGWWQTRDVTCNHDHPDNDALRDCGQRLARILAQGRVPKWATIERALTHG